MNYELEIMNDIDVIKKGSIEAVHSMLPFLRVRSNQITQPQLFL
jgi:hypothetical protein